MPNISSITHYPLKVIFAVHFILVTWVIQGGWGPSSLMFYNLIFFVCLLWAIQNSESDEPIQFALFVNVLSIFFDVVTLSYYFPDGAWRKVSAAVLIVTLVVRVISSFVLLKTGQARGGALESLFGSGPAMGLERQGYEDISQPVPNNADFA